MNHRCFWLHNVRQHETHVFRRSFPWCVGGVTGGLLGNGKDESTRTSLPLQPMAQRQRRPRAALRGSVSIAGSRPPFFSGTAMCVGPRRPLPAAPWRDGREGNGTFLARHNTQRWFDRRQRWTNGGRPMRATPTRRRGAGLVLSCMRVVRGAAPRCQALFGSRKLLGII